MEHKHLLINSTFNNSPFTSEEFTCDWIREIVRKIDMEILLEPKAVRCNEKDNEGISAFCLITTSHICLHSWEKSTPNLVQLDVYSCKEFDRNIILDEIDKFNPLSLGCKFLDRDTENTKDWRMFNEGLA